jgi:hypothetical protein
MLMRRTCMCCRVELESFVIRLLMTCVSVFVVSPKVGLDEVREMSHSLVKQCPPWTTIPHRQ